MLVESLLPVRGRSCSLRVLAVQDIERYLTGIRDPLVQEFGYLPVTEHTEEAVTQLAETGAPQGLQRGDLGVLSIVDEQDRFLGSLTFFNVTRNSAEVGIWLHPEERGSGHALGALELAVHFAKQCGLENLTAKTAIGSYSANHVIERLGFEEVARDITSPGGETAYIHYRLELID